jgi:hypothetical protein
MKGLVCLCGNVAHFDDVVPEDDNLVVKFYCPECDEHTVIPLATVEATQEFLNKMEIPYDVAATLEKE